MNERISLVGMSTGAHQRIPILQNRLALLIGATLLILVLSACAGAAKAPTSTLPAAAPTSPPAPQATATLRPLTAPPTAATNQAGPLPAIPIEQGDRARGEKLFSSVGCIGCHTVKGVGGNVGPDLSQVARRAPSRAATQGLDRPELYFVQSVVYPKAYVVEGFTPVMPNWKELQLTEKDLADIVAYLKTLTGE